MKRMLRLRTILLLGSLVTACAYGDRSERVSSTAPHTELPAGSSGAPSLTTDSAAADEAEIVSLVDAFGSRLQAVSLQSPNFVEEMMAEYAGLVDSSLLEEWSGDPSTAPGRSVSSPWPDRIEVASVDRISPGVYSVSGYVIEITSYELSHGGEAARLPVHITVGKLENQWLITGYELLQD